MIRSMSIRDFRNAMADALNRVAYGGEQIALTRRDTVVAVLVSYEDLQELRKYREEAGKAVSDDFEALADRIIDDNEKLYKRLADR